MIFPEYVVRIPPPLLRLGNQSGSRADGRVGKRKAE
jgi:hypothetical protein